MRLTAPQRGYQRHSNRSRRRLLGLRRLELCREWRYSQGDCVFGCEEMFGSFLESTQCKHYPPYHWLSWLTIISGSYDPHTFSGSGNNTQNCGVAYLVVNQPLVAPPVSTQTTMPSPSQTAVGPPLGVPTCGNGLFFQHPDAADSAKALCNQLAKDSSWAVGPQSLKFSNVKIYNGDGTVNTGQEFALSVSANAAWCPKDLTLETLGQKMTADRCWQNMMTGVDGCK